MLRRLRAALTGLLSDSAVTAEHKTVVRLYLEHLDQVVEHSILDGLAQAMALREDRQGLGFSRGAVADFRKHEGEEGDWGERADRMGSEIKSP